MATTTETTRRKLRKMIGKRIVGFQVCQAHDSAYADFRHLCVTIAEYTVCDAMNDVREALGWSESAQADELKRANGLREITGDTIYLRPSDSSVIEIQWQDDSERRNAWYGGRIEMKANEEAFGLLQKLVRKVGHAACHDGRSSAARRYVLGLIEQVGAIPVRYPKYDAIYDCRFDLDATLPDPAAKEADQPEAATVA